MEERFCAARHDGRPSHHRTIFLDIFGHEVEKFSQCISQLANFLSWKRSYRGAARSQILSAYDVILKNLSSQNSEEKQEACNDCAQKLLQRNSSIINETS